MTIILSEHEGCFSFDCAAESREEAALLVRLGMNSTKEVRSIGATVDRGGGFSAHVVIGKHRKANSTVPRRQ